MSHAEVPTVTIDDPRARWRRRLIKFAIQLAIFALVAWGLWRPVSEAQAKLSKERVDWSEIHLGLLAVSGVLYLAGMLPCSLFWRKVLATIDRPVPVADGIGAYFISQLGKYVPGKVLVLVIRTAMVRSYGVNKTLCVTAIFVETLTMMSVGAMLGAFFLAISVSADWKLVLFGGLAAAAVGAPTFPPVLVRIVKWTKLHRLHPEIDQTIARLRWQMLWPWWLAIAFGWLLMGLSLGAVINGLPGATPISTAQDVFILIACVALSTVVGFVSGLPGGLGARDLVVVQILQPHFGVTVGLIAAVIHRCVMMSSELIFAAILWGVSRARRDSSGPLSPERGEG